MDDLALSVTDANGTITRWGPDEPNATEIPGDLTFSTSMPGGFKDLSTSLLRRIDLDYRDQGLFDSVRVYGPGNRTVWEGRMAQFPRSHGDGFQIVPGAVGWSAHLNDDPSFMQVYVDRDPASWQDPALARRASLAGSSILQGDISWQKIDGGLMLPFPTNALGNPRNVTELWYKAPGGLKVAKLMYKAQSTGTLTGWTLVLNTATDDAGGGTTGIGSALFTDTLTTEAAFTAQRYVYLSIDSNSNSVTPAGGTSRRFTFLAAYGNHGLTLRTITGEPSGLYASDVIQNIVTTAAPSLTTGDIEATTFAIPHLVFNTPTTAESAIQFVNAFHGFDWGVYDNREFFYRSSNPDTLTWQARLSSGARLDLEGETAEQIFNGVYVTYTDPGGQTKTVGPPGANADATSSALEDTSLTNPVNSHGIDRRWGMLNVSEVTTLAGATQLGSIWLAEHGAPQRRGTLTLTGTVTHPTEGEVPVWRVRAGDYVSISDHPADVPRRIIETRYQHGQRQITLNLDNTPYILDALLQRFGSGLVGVL